MQDRTSAPLKVLYVEDSAPHREFVQEIMTELGHHVELAEDGQVALQLVKRNKFDLLISDYEMPIMDGLAATREIRAIAGEVNKLPIIMISGRIDDHARREAYRAGVTAFFEKPISPKDFRTLLLHILYAASQPPVMRSDGRIEGTARVLH